MRMILQVTTGLIVLAAAAAAQTYAPDLSTLPDVVKGLKWKDIDSSTLTPLERYRALLLLNDSLDEIGARARAEADLMSTYLDQQNLGAAFGGYTPPADPTPLTYPDTVKIATAMLRGPLAQSDYATAFSDVTDQRFIECTVHLFEATCPRKWSEVSESRRYVRWMSAFLQSQKKMQAYQEWVPAEVQRREQAYENNMAQRRAAAQAQKNNAEIERLRQQEQQQQKMLAQQGQQLQQVQNALGAAQAATQSSGATNVYTDGGWCPGWYYGAVSDLGRNGWYRDAAYRGAAGVATEQRMTGWHNNAGSIPRSSPGRR